MNRKPRKARPPGGPGPGRGNEGFVNDDADQDGRVSSDEFSGPEDHFNQLDVDGDGYISEDEARPKAGIGPPPAINDTDGCGE